jgi:hypothetical protein
VNRENARWDGGHVHFVLLHGGVVAVVAVVGDAPAEVGRPEGGVEDVAEDVADGLGRGEGAVAALRGGSAGRGRERDVGRVPRGR